jgi:hypothetical protein
MRTRARLATAVLLAGVIPATVHAQSAGQRSTAAGVFYTGVAVAANVVPVLPTLYAPRCLLGYVFCKATFAGLSVVAAADQIIISGGQDWEQTRGILYRGFAGDWVLTARHTSREMTPQVLPDPPPPATNSGWTPPPI